MEKTKLIIVGGVAAGASAAAKARRCSEEAAIVIFEKGDHISYANCGLPYYLSGVIPKREQLLIVDPPFFKKRFNVEVKTGHEVVGLDAAAKRVTVREVASGRIFAEDYDKLILAPGADPVLPPIPGVAKPFVFHLKTLRDTDRIYQHLQGTRPRAAVVIGGGLIGMEAVENLAALGIETTVVEFLPQVLSFLDVEMAEMVHAELRAKGVNLCLGDRVTAISEQHGRGVVETGQGRKFAADLVIMAIGIRPNVELAKQAGLDLGVTGGIKTNELMQTSNPDIYAAGDCVESINLVTGKPALVPMGSAANKQGRAAGANALGGRIPVKGFTGTAIVKVFDLAVAVSGLSEKAAAQENLNPYVTYVLAGHHAGYYPGAKVLKMKIVAAADSGRLLGAQIIGPEGVDKRIDVMATAIYNRMAAEELIQLDLAYAPPYAAARDLVIVAGALAQNYKAGAWQPLSPLLLRAKMERGEAFTLVDMRSLPELKRSGTIAGAIHIPIDELRGRLAELPRDQELVVYCAVGLRSYLGSRILAMNGFADVYTLAGGLGAWPFALVPYE